MLQSHFRTYEFINVTCINFKSYLAKCRKSIDIWRRLIGLEAHARVYLRDDTQMFNSPSSSVDGKVIWIFLTINPLKDHRLMISEWYLSDSISASSNKCTSLRRDIGILIMMDAASPFNLGQSPGWLKSGSRRNSDRCYYSHVEKNIYICKGVRKLIFICIL